VLIRQEVLKSSMNGVEIMEVMVFKETVLDHMRKFGTLSIPNLSLL
jgi:hypothetical protein